MSSALLSAITSASNVMDVDISKEKVENIIKSFKVATEKDVDDVIEKVRPVMRSVEESEREVNRILSQIRERERQEGDENFDPYAYQSLIHARDMQYTLINEKYVEYNNIIHQFVRERNLATKISTMLSEIDFDRVGNDRIFHLMDITSRILDAVIRDTQYEECKCMFGHAGSDLAL